jgi:hypothetical protein
MEGEDRLLGVAITRMGRLVILVENGPTPEKNPPSPKGTPWAACLALKMATKDQFIRLVGKPSGQGEVLKSGGNLPRYRNASVLLLRSRAASPPGALWEFGTLLRPVPILRAALRVREGRVRYAGGSGGQCNELSDEPRIRPGRGADLASG